MSKFTFIMPDGQLFTLTGPAGSTQAQAEKIYLEQLQAGALVGLRPGDTLENKTAKIEKFELNGWTSKYCTETQRSYLNNNIEIVEFFVRGPRSRPLSSTVVIKNKENNV